MRHQKSCPKVRFPALKKTSWSPHRGEAMEQGLRDCCRSIRIGKILIQSDEETQRAKVYYAKFPPDIYRRKVLLMYPILSDRREVIRLCQDTHYSAAPV
ncbi:uracil phosphoribosyltransferase homolog isoform X2 [Pyrgilauda ruficollis]|uniref:uracil phosphoribosyltransferase homolog isoform X2 n=1 Tax=Pyrgilauda ruficollis TaxID=221976 RepID=UPI001B87930A|nr:uracil phosphoribosyltransferase homolog isoform X2 [Pyrgilauda ruficollis]